MNDVALDSLPVTHQVMYSSLGMSGLGAEKKKPRHLAAPQIIKSRSKNGINSNFSNTKLSNNYQIASQSAKHQPRGEELGEDGIKSPQGEYFDREGT